MPNIACPSKIDCQPCQDEPIINVSSETPDQDRFLARFSYLNAFPPIRQFPDFDMEPGAGGIFLQIGCLRWCWSTISQEDADLCAAAQSVQCAFDPLVPGFPIPTPLSPNRIALFYNQAATGTYTCPDGNVFSFTLAANQIVALTQGQANALAVAVARQRARSRHLCISNLDEPICEGSFYIKQVTASGPNVAVFPAQDNWELVSGTLPPGMTLEEGFSSDGISFSGVATTIGEYTFTVRCTISTFGSPGFGDSMQKTFTVKVVGINESSPLPDATLGVPYSQQLTAASSTDVAGESWSVVSGALPDGLSMSEQGLISGTPTGALAGYSFTAQVFYFVGGNKALCTKNFTITTTAITLLSYWAFEDAPPDYDDSTGNGNTLLHFAGDVPTAVPGKIGNGAQVTSNDPPFVGSETILRITSFSGVPTSPSGWTAFGWIDTAFGAQSTVALIQVDSVTSISSIVLSLITPAVGNRFRLDLLGSGPLVGDSALSVLLSAGTHFWVMWWDATTGIASLQIDDGAVVNVATPWIPTESPVNSPILFGMNGRNSAVISFQVRDETGIIGKVLTAQQRTDLWNAGNGVTWPQVGVITQS